MVVELPGWRSFVAIFVPWMLKLCTADPAFATTSLPFRGTAMLVGVIANSLRVTCTAPAGTPVVLLSA